MSQSCNHIELSVFQPIFKKLKILEFKIRIVIIYLFEHQNLKPTNQDEHECNS